MKKVLRFIITIAIVIGIVFGIKYLVDKGDDGKSIYVELTDKNIVAAASQSNIEKGLDKFDNYLNSEETEALVPEKVRTSSTSGELFRLRQIVNYQQSLLRYFYEKSALIKSPTKDLANNVMSSYEQLAKQIGALNQSVTGLTDNYLAKVANPNASDFEYKFNQMTNEYKKVVNLFAKFNYDMDKLVSKDCFDNNKVDLTYIQNDISAQVVYAGFQANQDTVDYNGINEQLNNVQTLKSKLSTEQAKQKFIVDYNNVDNLLGYLQSSNKAEFIKDLPNKASYEAVGKIIYGTDVTGGEA